MYKMGFGNVGKIGACALVAVVSGNKVYAANAGDSQGLLISENNEANDFSFTKLNKKLNANSKKEQQRLLKAFPLDKNIFHCKRGLKSCYVKGRLQPTRSFGDFYL